MARGHGKVQSQNEVEEASPKRAICDFIQGVWPTGEILKYLPLVKKGNLGYNNLDINYSARESRAALALTKGVYKCASMN